jgi:hypothetical protein
MTTGQVGGLPLCLGEGSPASQRVCGLVSPRFGEGVGEGPATPAVTGPLRWAFDIILLGLWCLVVSKL